MQKRHQKTRKEIARSKSEPSTPEKKVAKQHVEVNKLTEDLDSRGANTVVESLKLTPKRQELDKRAQIVQKELIEEACTSIGVSCAVQEEKKLA